MLAGVQLHDLHIHVYGCDRIQSNKKRIVQTVSLNANMPTHFMCNVCKLHNLLGLVTQLDVTQLE